MKRVYWYSVYPLLNKRMVKPLKKEQQNSIEKYQIENGRPDLLGVNKIGEDYFFSIDIPKNSSCILELFQCNEKMPFLSISTDEFFVKGTVYSVKLSGLPNLFEYLYIVNDQPFVDPYSHRLVGRSSWGHEYDEKPGQVRSVVTDHIYQWEDDKNPGYSFDEVIMYSMHVRGFTEHSSSGVKARGTFLGIVEKISYLIELGINQIELMPAYDFSEVLKENDMLSTDQPKRNINYWGFSKGFYFTPKAGYSYTTDPVNEFKDMVKALHKAGIEVVMQFYFPVDVGKLLILECIQYWVMEYHIDGIHLFGDNLPVTLIASIPMLANTKIYYNDFATEEIYQSTYHGVQKNLAIYQQKFAEDMRKFLKSDEDMLQSFAYHMRRIPKETGIINYITQYAGFTLNDLVSYDYKHNEENGEDNRDGDNYNYSWNCGIEGTTQKKAVLTLRKKQIKNALIFLLFSQGTPMLLAGDEFTNSQRGNNNPYCQDNAIGWLEWKKNQFSAEILCFVKNLIHLRKLHPILHPSDEFRIMDYISCGYPDLSYHGDAAWYPKFDNHIRYIGVMLCGKYAKKNRIEEDNFFFLACNMHWDSHEFGLPKLPKTMQWYRKVDTGARDGHDFYKDGEEVLISDQENLTVMDRSIVVLIALQKTLCYDVKRNKKT